MEKHKCRLCLKIFPNGRALGGHMRSHMMNLPIPSKLENEEEKLADLDIQLTVNVETQLASTSEEGEGEREEEKPNFYVLRDNPKQSSRLVDPEFFDVGSVVLLDRESETDSSKNPTRQRSKRARKEQIDSVVKEKKINRGEVTTMPELWTEPEPVSSISDSTTEEDIAFCLMLLSRDKWKRKEQGKSLQSNEEEDDHKEEEEEDDDEESQEESYGSDEFKSCNYNKSNARARGKYRCETCHKVFKSYQALGGHRASHKKEKLIHSRNTHNQPYHAETRRLPSNAIAPPSQQAKKIHECPYCFRVFSSGQALGGHKRSHLTRVVATTTTTPMRNSLKLGDSLSMIDLNLPAPAEDYNISQIELSVMSDSKFVNHIQG